MSRRRMSRTLNFRRVARVWRRFPLFVVAGSVLTVAAVIGIASFHSVRGAPSPQRPGPAVTAPSSVRPNSTAVLSWGVQDKNGRFVGKGLTKQASDYAKIDLVVTEKDGDRRVVPLAQKTADDGRERVRIPRGVSTGERVSFRVAVFETRESVPSGVSLQPPKLITAATSRPASVGKTPFALFSGDSGGGGGGSGGGGGGSGGGGGGDGGGGSAPPNTRTVMLSAVTTGTWEQRLDISPTSYQTFARSDANYVAGHGGHLPDCNCEQRNYFVFDMSSISGTIVSGNLVLDMPENSFGGVTPGIDPIETYTLYDVLSVIHADGYLGEINRSTALSLNGSAQFDDLGSGNVYGSREFSEADEGTVISIPLTDRAIPDLNAADSLFAIGGTMTTLDLSHFTEAEIVFGGTGGNTPNRYLQLTVAE